MLRKIKPATYLPTYLCHVRHVHSPISKVCEETARTYPQRAAKTFPTETLCQTKRLTTWSLKMIHKNAINSEENVHDEMQRSVKTPSDLQRKVTFCPPRRPRAPLLRCNMSDLKSVYNIFGERKTRRLFLSACGGSCSF